MRKNKIVFLVSGSVLFLTACDQGSSGGQFLAKVEGTGCVVEQITSQPFDEYQFQGVSPNGKWLSYSWDKGENEKGHPDRGVFFLSLESGHMVIPPEEANNSGAFSPDGFFLTGSRFTETGRDIYEYNLKTEEVKPIAPHPAKDFLPSYSPDGKKIVFNSFRTGGSDIYLYERETASLERLTDYEGYDAHAEFSPNGQRILFHRMVSRKEEGGYNFELFVYNLQNGEEIQLTKGTPYEESYGSWSPDGTHVVMSSDFEEEPEQHNLYIIDMSGEIVSKLTNSPGPETYSFWTRNGAYIYFQGNRDGQTDIFRIPMVGNECQKAS